MVSKAKTDKAIPPNASRRDGPDASMPLTTASVGSELAEAISDCTSSAVETRKLNATSISISSSIHREHRASNV